MSGRERRARRAALLRTAKACGPGTRCWCQASRRHTQPNRDMRCHAIRGATVARGSRRRGERVISCKPLRGECRMFSGASAVNTRVHTYYPSAREAAGALGTRHSPRPLFSKGDGYRHASGAIRVASVILFLLFENLNQSSTRVRRPCRRPAIPGGPCGRRAPYCGSQSASRPLSPSPVGSAHGRRARQ